MEILILRLEAPLMSFGAPMVDRHGVIQPYPASSMIVGLLANALGYDHAEHARLQRLQNRVEYAVRQDKQGSQVQDYHTVDLSQDYMHESRAWTTRGELEGRKGGSASSGTHIRLRDYWADAIYTVAVMLQDPDEAPTLQDVEQALANPARPLFIGRKTCLPSGPILIGRMDADDLLDALRRTDLPERADGRARYRAWWPTRADAAKPSDDTARESMRRPVTDERDWRNQIHVGGRWLAEGEILLDVA